MTYLPCGKHVPTPCETMWVPIMCPNWQEPTPSVTPSPFQLPMECAVYLGHLSRGAPEQQCTAAAYLRKQLCGSANLSRGVVESGAVAPLVLLLRDGPAEAKVGIGRPGCHVQHAAFLARA